MGDAARAGRDTASVARHRLPISLQRLLLPDRLRLDESIRHAALTTVLFGVSMILWCLVFSPVHVAMGSWRCAGIIALAAVAFLLNVLALRIHLSLVVTSNVTAGIVLVTLLALSVYSGGYRAAAMLWLPTVPMIAILLMGWRTGVSWLLLTAGLAWSVFLLDGAGVLPHSDLTPEDEQLLFILGLVGIVCCITLLSFLFEAVADALRTRLEVARRGAEEASRAKSAFLARMSHEIRTPMNGVLGMLELLTGTKLEARQAEYARFATQSAESLLRILNDVLDFSKIEAGRLELESVVYDLHDVVGDTLQTLAVEAEAKGLELACDLEPETPHEVVGDPGRLRQILVNLVGNAIKFTERGEVVVTVRPVEASGNQVVLEIVVRDTGIGVPAEKQSLIWDVFGQADTSMTRRFGGTGLGVNISRELVRMMGGELELESEEGRGTTFRFTVRLGVHAGGPHGARSRGLLEGVRVLVVDDNATNRFILEELLGRWGMHVTSAEGAEEALSALEKAAASKDPIRIALLDVMMPGTDGLMLAEAIRRDHRVDDLPLILLSSAFVTEGRRRCETLGIGRQLRKPVKQSELLDALCLALHPELVERAARQEVGPAAPGRSLRILLAEDGAVNRQVAVGLLTRQGHEVTAVENGREALEAWRAGSFDLVLMDLEMPEMDGLEATRRIRDSESHTGAHVPIVALTAHAIRDFEQRCLAAGMDAHLAKPLKPAMLHETIVALTSASDAPGGSARDSPGAEG